MSDIIKLVLIIVFIIFLVAIGPVLTIWSLNTLFPVLAIPLTLETWASVVLLGAFLKGSVNYKK